jgi:RluA family pseudouridine synthase
MELDEFLCLQFPLLNKGFLRRQIRERKVTVDGNPADPGQRLSENEVVIVDFEEDEALPAAPQAPEAEVPVLYEDGEVLVVDKPAGLSAEPERWAREAGCLSGAVLAMALKRSGVEVQPEDGATPVEGVSYRPRLVHRLDKDTTGAVIVAKTLEAERRLRAAFDEPGAVQKSYLALVEGEWPLADGESELVDLPIGPDERRSGRMRVDRADGKPSQTRFTVEERFEGYTLMRAEPLTGRTHQIRVHAREVGFPLAVDAVYGRRSTMALSEFKRSYKAKRGHVEAPLMQRQTLHAASIVFPGVDGRPVRVEAPLPKDYLRLLKQLRKYRAT